MIITPGLVFGSSVRAHAARHTAKHLEMNVKNTPKASQEKLRGVHIIFYIPIDQEADTISMADSGALMVPGQLSASPPQVPVTRQFPSTVMETVA